MSRLVTVRQPTASGSSCGAWAAQAFGLSLRADFEMPGLPSAALEHETGRGCDLSLRPGPTLEDDWATDGWERVFELVDDGGRLACTLDVRDGIGARFWGRAYGSFCISSDGSRVCCYPGGVKQWRWRRFLVGQVLPLASLLHGLEVLHASSVEVDGEGLVFAGPSRAGKSSIAARLNLRGAAFVADDVVSIERREGVVVAHPGTGMISLRHEECALWSHAELQLLGTPVAELETELLIAPARKTSRPCPVRGVYLLNRSSLDAPLSFEEMPDPRYLLGSTYINVLRPRDRLVRMLDVHSALSRSAGVFRVNIPSSMTAAVVADAVYDHHRARDRAGERNPSPR